MVDGKLKSLLVHRKGATRAFPPHHPLIPVDYQFTGQPVLIGGTMGTCSYVLTGKSPMRKEIFCEISDVTISWKKISRGLPRPSQSANDRAPTINEIRKIINYPDRRIKAIIYTMVSSGIRL